MKVRYKQGLKGPEVVAKVYSKQEHLIDFNKIDSDAISIIEKLKNRGFESYLVGGAIRDLLLGKNPKDFDVVTAASPRQVHKIFYNSRIIGRRFKIVHITFGEKIIEVSTFRSVNDHADSYQNQFGTLEEDATRRDFSINSLYYDPDNETIIDFNNAMDDFKKKRITSIIPINYTFNEDPVRMIRAIKYHVTTGFKLKHSISRAIKFYASNLSYVSTSRLTEEVNKILYSGNCNKIFKELIYYRLFAYILPGLVVYSNTEEFETACCNIDKYVLNYKCKKDIKSFDKGILYYYLTEKFILLNKEIKKSNEIFKDVFRQIKILISPNTPPNIELERACYKFLETNGIKLPNPNKGKKSAQPLRKHG